MKLLFDLISEDKDLTNACCRERELLHPILEEDNESTASGSLLNLQQASSGGSLHSLQHAANNAPAASASAVNGSSVASRNTVAPAANGSSADDAGISNSATAGSSSASGWLFHDVYACCCFQSITLNYLTLNIEPIFEHLESFGIYSTVGNFFCKIYQN